MRRPQAPRSRATKVAVRTCDGVEIRESFEDRRYNHRDTMMNYRGDGGYIGVPGATASRFGPCPAAPLGDDFLSHDYRDTPRRSALPPTVMQAMVGVSFIADHLKQQDEFNKVSKSSYPASVELGILCVIFTYC